MKHFYDIEQYQKDIKTISEVIDKFKNPHLVCLYRGSLGLGAHLSNIHNIKLSIIDFQSYDGSSKEPILIKNAGIQDDENIIVIDDIGDTYNTLQKCYDLLNKITPNIFSITLFGKKELNKLVPSNIYLHEHPNKWIVFWSEEINEKV